jgi:hypothetical protein
MPPGADTVRSVEDWMELLPEVRLAVIVVDPSPVAVASPGVLPPVVIVAAPVLLDDQVDEDVAEDVVLFE